MEEGAIIWEVYWEVGKCHGPGAQSGLQCLEKLGVSRRAADYWGSRDSSSGEAGILGRVLGPGNVGGRMLDHVHDAFLKETECAG